MEQLGTDFNATGSVMSRAELEEQRRKRGECVTCGRKCFQKKLFKMIPITDHGRVLNGRCLNCHPLDSADTGGGVIPAVSRPATQADLDRFTRSQNVLRSTQSVHDINNNNVSGNASVGGSSNDSVGGRSRRRASHMDHGSARRSSSRSNTRRGVHSSGALSSRSLAGRSVGSSGSSNYANDHDNLSVGGGSARGAIGPHTTGRSMESVQSAPSQFNSNASVGSGSGGRGQDSGMMPPNNSRPLMTRPNSNRSISQNSYYSTRSRGSADGSNKALRRHEQHQQHCDEDASEDFDDYNGHHNHAATLNSDEYYAPQDYEGGQPMRHSDHSRSYDDSNISYGGADDAGSYRHDQQDQSLDYYHRPRPGPRENSSRSLRSAGSADEYLHRTRDRDASFDRRGGRRPSHDSERRLSNDSGVEDSYSQNFQDSAKHQSFQESMTQQGTTEMMSGGGSGRSNRSGSAGNRNSRIDNAMGSSRSIESGSSYEKDNDDASGYYSYQRGQGEMESYRSNGGIDDRYPPNDTAGAEPPVGVQDDELGLMRLRQAGHDFVEILHVMRAHQDSADVQAVAMQTLSNVELNPQDSSVLATSGLIPAVAEAMDVYRTDLEIQIFGCRTIWNASGTTENQRLFVEQGALDIVLQAMTNFLTHAELQEQALAVMANLAAGEFNVPAIQESGVIEKMVEVMNKHASNSEVQIKGCLALANLASHASAPKQKMVKLGGGSAIVISMVMHPNNPELQEKALRALRNLSANCDENRVELTNIGGIDAIISAMQVHRDAAGVQEAGAWTLSNLGANPDSKILIGDCGGVDVIVRAMWVHSDRPSVQEWCCRALFTLAMDLHNSQMILGVGGISAVVNAMQAHVDSAGVQEMGCAVLCNLARDQQSKMRIVDEEALDAVVLAMVLHSDDGKVQERACQLLLELSIAENFKAMQASNVGELVRSAAMKFPENCGDSAERLIHVIEGFISDYT